MPPSGCRRSTRRFWPSRAPAHTCTSAGRRRSRRPRTARARTSTTLFAHIAGRLGRAPRFRQRIAPDALGLNAPLWIDAEDFDPAEHIHRSAAEDLPQLADAVLSEPLRRDRPLWEFWIADRLRDGRIGLVGKAHHCMVDGLAAVELGTLLLDAEPAGGAAEDDARLAARPRPPRARAAGPRRLGPHARAARAAAPPARARPLPARAARPRAAHRPRARRRGAAGRAVERAQRARLAGAPPRHRAAAARRAARDQQRARGHGQRRAARRRRRRAAPPRPARRGAPARPQGDGAGQRPRRRRRRARQPHHVHVRRAARRPWRTRCCACG